MRYQLQGVMYKLCCIESGARMSQSVSERAVVWKSGLWFPARRANLCLLHSIQMGSGVARPPLQWLPGALSREIKRPGHDTDCSLRPRSELRNNRAPCAIRFQGVVINLLSAETTSPIVSNHVHEDRPHGYTQSLSLYRLGRRCGAVDSFIGVICKSKDDWGQSRSSI
jgi:hypothetical protein